MNAQVMYERSFEMYGESSDDLAGFHFYVLTKSKYVENDIYKVFLNNKDSSNRLGWVFPIHAISSDQHRFNENIHFIGFAKVANKYLKSLLETSDGSELFSKDGELYENTHLLILERSKTTKISDPLSLAASFAKFGYYFSNYSDSYSNSKVTSVVETDDPESLIVYSTIALTSNDYIQKLFCEYLPREKHSYLRVMLLYQIFEMMMEVQFYKKIDFVKEKRYSLGTIRERFTDLSSEKKIIKNIFNDCGFDRSLSLEEMNLIKSIYEDLRDKSFYDALMLSDLVYEIRNAHVHSFFKFKKLISDKSTADWFEMITLQLIEVTFQKKLFKTEDLK